MLQIRFVRENPDVVRNDLNKRQDKEKLALLEEVLRIDEEHRSLMQESQRLRHERNELSNRIREAKKAGKDATSLLGQAKNMPEQIEKIEKRQNEIEERICFITMRLPNILHDSVKFGKSEADNEVLREVGKKKVKTAKSHVDIIEQADLYDAEHAVKIAGSRFYFLKNDLVLLDLALQRFALDRLLRKGLKPIMPPFMIRKKAYEGVTDLADFGHVLYRIESMDEENQKEEDTLYLIATSEHAIAAMYMDHVFEPSELPLKYAGVSACFRREAGSHGKDTKGLFRVHQFNKVEQFIFCTEHDSWKHFDELLQNAEELFQELELPYRAVSMCTAEIGLVAAKKVDLEVWMPAQGKYREIVSCSNCTAYQSARLNMKYRTPAGNKYVHTLNSTAIPTSRTIVAIVENFQQADGSFLIPKALQPYMNGRVRIGSKKKQKKGNEQKKQMK